MSGLAGKADDLSSANLKNLEALEDIDISAADPATGRGSVADGLTFGLNFLGKLDTNKPYNLEIGECLEGTIEIRDAHLFYQDTTSGGSPDKVKDPQPLDPSQEGEEGRRSADRNQNTTTVFAARVSQHINSVHDGRREMVRLPTGGVAQGGFRPERRNLRGNQGASTEDLLKQMVDGIRKELVKQLGEPPKIPCGEKKSIPAIELKLEKGYHLRGSSLSTGEFVKYTLTWTVKITIGCKNTAECCPTVPTVVGPQDQPEEEGGTLLGPTPTEEEGVEAPPTGDIGPGGGAGGAGSVVARTCDNFTLEGATAVRAGERVNFKITANFFPNKDEMFSQFVGAFVRDSAGNNIGGFGLQNHAGVESNFGSTVTGDRSSEVNSSLSLDGKEVTISVPGDAVPPGATVRVQGGCIPTSGAPFQDKSLPSIFLIE